MRYWKQVDDTKKTKSVESYSHNLDLSSRGLIEITKEEYDEYISNLKPPKEIPHRGVSYASAQVNNNVLSNSQRAIGKKKFKSAVTDAEKIQVIAELLRIA